MSLGPVAHGHAAGHEAITASMQVDGGSVRTPTPRELVARQSAITALMRKRGDLMSPQAFQIVMEIARQPGMTMQELVNSTEMSLASVSRNLMALGQWHRLGRPGLNLVETVDDPVERRRKIAFLTHEGRKFVSEVLSVGLPAADKIDFEAPTAKDFLNKTYRGS